MFGFPLVIRGDNGPQFSSSIFASFCHTWGIEWCPSSPYNPQSNGLAERTVRTLKETLLKLPKVDISTTEALEVILLLRNTPREDGASPAMRMFSRVLRTRIPTRVDITPPIDFIKHDLKRADSRSRQESLRFASSRHQRQRSKLHGR